MKSKTMGIIMLAVLATSLSLIVPVNASTFPNLPEDPVDLVLTVGPTTWPGTVALSNVPAGYDVSNSPPNYIAWCAQLLNWIDPGTTYPTTLESSLDLTPQETWNAINWLLNQEVDKDLDVQIAIWLLLGFDEADLASHGYTKTAAAQAMFDDAVENDDFIPSCGQIVAVYCRIAVEYDDSGEEVQDLFIELQIPCAPGLTPGFWKNNLAVYLGLANGNREYSDPTGSPTVTKDTMGDFLDSLAGTYDLNQLYRDLCPQLDGTTAAIRDAAANVFNVAAGLSPGPPWV